MDHERLNIVLKSLANERAGDVELPLRLLFVGNYMGKDVRPIEDRVPVRIDRESFGKVLAAHAPQLELVVSPAGAAAAIRASLTFQSLSDFGPDAIARQIPETARLLDVRDALTELKKTRDEATFRARLEALLPDAAERARLLDRIGLGPARSKRADPNENTGPARSKRADPNDNEGA
jgi:type VI secretion system protein ImpB